MNSYKKKLYLLVYISLLFCYKGIIADESSQFLSSLNQKKESSSEIVSKQKEEFVSEKKSQTVLGNKKRDATIGAFLASLPSKKISSNQTDIASEEKNIGQLQQFVQQQNAKNKQLVAEGRKKQGELLQSMKDTIANYQKELQNDAAKRSEVSSNQLELFSSLFENPLYESATKILKDQSLRMQYEDAMNSISFSFDLYEAGVMKQLKAEEQKEVEEQESLFTTTMEHWKLKQPGQQNLKYEQDKAKNFMDVLSTVHAPAKKYNSSNEKKEAASFITGLSSVKEKTLENEKNSGDSFLSGLSKYQKKGDEGNNVVSRSKNNNQGRSSIENEQSKVSAFLSGLGA